MLAKYTPMELYDRSQVAKIDQRIRNRTTTTIVIVYEPNVPGHDRIDEIS